jgi:deazaflavin-dependent oxidoreductase (nitroreductase family)
VVFPRRLARVNRRVANPLLRPVARLTPPLAVIEHRGRRSGRTYRTPVFAFRRGDEILVVLSYGRNSHWVRNLRAAGHGALIRGMRRYRMMNIRTAPVAQCGPLGPLGRFSTRFADDVLIAELRPYGNDIRAA